MAAQLAPAGGRSASTTVVGGCRCRHDDLLPVSPRMAGGSGGIVRRRLLGPGGGGRRGGAVVGGGGGTVGGGGGLAAGFTTGRFPTSLRLLRPRLRCSPAGPVRGGPLLFDHVDQPPRQVDAGLLDAPMAVGLHDLADVVVGVGIGHLVLPVQGHGGAGLDHVRQLGVKVVRRRDGVVLGGVGAVGRVDGGVVGVVVEEDGEGVDRPIVGGASVVIVSGGGIGGGTLLLLVGHLVRISDGTGEAKGPQPPGGIPEEVGHGHGGGAGGRGTATEHHRGRRTAAHEAEGLGQRLGGHHANAGAAAAATACGGAVRVAAVGRRRRAAGRMVRREAEDVVPPLLDGELGGRPLPPSAAAVATTSRWSVLVFLGGAAGFLPMGIPPSVGKHVHVVGLGVHQVLVVIVGMVVGRPSPAVAVLGRRRPPSAAAARAAAVMVAQADLHFGRLELVVVGISKTGSAAIRRRRRAVETPRQRLEEQIHRHGGWCGAVEALLWGAGS